ncbi:hypothetical protein N9444_10365 [Gammaproteobacteria bacterium]|nr:hypothetical protein [Gammaproteobacteria bacterium]
MDTFLEKETHLVSPVKYPGSDYGWCIKERDADGQWGAPYYPWSHGISFDATELAYKYSLFENYGEDYSIEIEEQEHIDARLTPSEQGPKQVDVPAPTLSMFGTDRIIDDFSLKIFEVDSENPRGGVNISGYPTFVAEWDYHRYREDDAIDVRIYLSKKRFTYLVDAVKKQRLDSLRVVLDSVAGLYARSSPGVTSDHFKVLTKSLATWNDEKDRDHHRVIKPDGWNDFNPEFELPALGSENSNYVSDRFYLHMVQKNDSNKEDIFEDKEEESLPASQELDTRLAFNQRLLDTLARAQENLAKLQTSVWLIFGVLVLLLLVLWVK